LRYQGWIPTLKFDILTSCVKLGRSTEIKDEDVVLNIIGPLIKRRLDKAKEKLGNDDELKKKYLFREFSDELKNTLLIRDYNVFSITIHHHDVGKPPDVAILLAMADDKKRMTAKRVLDCKIDANGRLIPFASFDVDRVSDNGLFCMRTDCEETVHAPNIAYEAVKYFYHRHKYHDAGKLNNGDCILDLHSSEDSIPYLSEDKVAGFILDAYIRKFNNYRMIMPFIPSQSEIPLFRAQACGELAFARSLNDNVLSKFSKEDADDFDDRLEYLWSRIDVAADSQILLFNEIDSENNKRLTLSLGICGIYATLLAAFLSVSHSDIGFIFAALIFATLPLLFFSMRWIFSYMRSEMITPGILIGDYDKGYADRKNLKHIPTYQK